MITSNIMLILGILGGAIYAAFEVKRNKASK